MKKVVVHECCGCSCGVCEDGHGSGPQPHTKECIRRFYRRIAGA